MLTRLSTIAILMMSFPHIFMRNERTLESQISTGFIGPENDICRQISPLMGGAFDIYHQAPQAITPKVTEELIAETLVGFTSEMCRTVVEEIMLAREIHPNIAAFIDFVLTHSPEFRTYSNEQIYSGNGGIYVPGEISLYLNKNLINFEVIIHEYRHAALHAAHRILNLTSPLSTEVYIPNTAQERNKILKMLDSSNNRIAELKKVLIRESQYQQLTLAENEWLAKLRKKTSAVYNKYYCEEHTFNLREKDFKTLNILLQTEITIGNIYQTDYYTGELLGKYQVKAINPRFNQEGILLTDITILMIDPLYAFLKKIDLIERTINNPVLYSKENILFERDAYLHQKIPQDLLVEFFPEFYAYTNSLIQKARSIAIPYQNKVAFEYKAPDLLKRYKNDLLIEMSNPEYFMPENAEEYIKVAYSELDKKQYEVTKIAMTTLIKNKLQLADAYKIRALIASEEKSFSAAATYFKKSLSFGAKLSSWQQSIYYSAINKTRNPPPKVTALPAHRGRKAFKI